MKSPFLDFYGANSVIPTWQEIPNQQLFFRQRDFLLRSLGIPPALLRGKVVLEIGPGTGQKALHLLSYSPSKYVAVDGNETSILKTSEAISDSGFQGLVEVRCADFTSYEDADSYDIVLAESVVPTQEDPEAFLLRLKSLLSIDGGILIYTCMDAASLLPEILRRAIVRDLGMNSGQLEEDALRIVAFFEKDLDLLRGMDRKRTDWAIDQMLQPWSGPLLDIPTSLEFLSDGVEFLGSSPRLANDGRWYKDPSALAQSSISWEIDSFWTHCHKLVDNRVWSHGRSSRQNGRLYDAAGELYGIVMHSLWSADDRRDVGSICQDLVGLLPRTSSSTLKSLASFIEYWNTGNLHDLDQFRPWWGRGQQYVSVVTSGRDNTE